METPESFQSSTPKKTLTATDRQLGKWALILVMSGVIILLLIIAIAGLSNIDLGNIAVLLGIFLVIVGLAVGIVGRRSPLGKAAIITSAILIGSLSLVLPFGVVTNSSSESSIVTVEYSDSKHQEE